MTGEPAGVNLKALRLRPGMLIRSLPSRHKAAFELWNRVYGTQLMPLQRHALAVLVAVSALMGSAALAGAVGEWDRPLGSAYEGPEVRMRSVAPAAPL